MNVDYRVVEDYYRQEHFDFFRRYPHPFYSTTVRLDVTALRAFTKERGYPLYLSLCYYMTRAMRAIEDFRYRLLDERIVLYDEIHPGLTVPAPGGLFGFAYYPYHPDVATFHERARPISAALERDGATLRKIEHRNMIFFTALPKVPFTSFTHATLLPTDTEPQVAFGQYSEQHGRLMVPIGLQFNHVFIDGNAIGELVEGVERWYAEPA